MDEEDKKFEVRDKRIFNQEGEQVREPSKESPAPDFSPAGEVGGKHTEQGGPHSHPEGELPPVDFISFVGSLGASALMYLGEKVAPDQPEGLKRPPRRKADDRPDRAPRRKDQGKPDARTNPT